MDSEEHIDQKLPLFEQTFDWDDFKAIFHYEENPKSKKQLKNEFKKIGNKAEDEKNLEMLDILNFYFNKEGKKIKKNLNKEPSRKVLESLESSENGFNEKVLKVMVLNEL